MPVNSHGTVGSTTGRLFFFRFPFDRMGAGVMKIDFLTSEVCLTWVLRRRQGIAPGCWERVFPPSSGATAGRHIIAAVSMIVMAGLFIRETLKAFG